jgi:hypothetical protein
MEDLYVSKSFCCIGKNTQNCLGCSFCRAQNKGEFEYSTIPARINPYFINLPVAVNLFYGDPLVYRDSTIQYLKLLEASGHTAPVLLITKGRLNTFKLPPLNLNLHFAFSTFGMKHPYDMYSHERLVENIKIFEKRGYPYKKSIEFRPICYGINDSKKTIDGVFKIAAKHQMAIGYSGLQGVPELVKHWEETGIDLHPYPGFKFGHKKSISSEVQDIFYEMSIRYAVPIFRKTSCLISYVHNMPRDYNAHYYRPIEMDCGNCPMAGKCFKFKRAQCADKKTIEHLIPFDFTIEERANHTCILKKKGVCEFPSDDCSHISGKIIFIQEKLSTADVRVIKWLTGYTVDADFTESSFLNDKWKTNKNYYEL